MLWNLDIKGASMNNYGGFSYRLEYRTKGVVEIPAKVKIVMSKESTAAKGSLGKRYSLTPFTRLSQEPKPLTAVSHPPNIRDPRISTLTT